MPYYRFSIDVPLKPEEAVRRVADLTAPTPSAPFRTTRDSAAQPFHGTVDPNGFRIRRVIRNRNDFLPRIHGTIQEAREGSRVKVSMRLSTLLSVFVAIWLAIAGLSFVGALLSGRDQWLAAGFLLFGIALTGTAFYVEAFKARRILEEHLRKS